MSVCVSQLQLEQRLQRSIQRIKQEGSEGGAAYSTLSPELDYCSFEEKSAVFHYTVPAEARNMLGIMHGGLQAVLYDTLMGILCSAYTESRRATTVNLSLSFLRPAPLGSALRQKVCITHLGRNVIHLTGVLWPDGRPDQPVSTATAIFYPLSAS